MHTCSISFNIIPQTQIVQSKDRISITLWGAFSRVFRLENEILRNLENHESHYY
jgi:hypothetical protein